MYLTTLLLNPNLARVQRDLASCSAMHSRVLSVFGPPEALSTGNTEAAPTLRERLDILYRVESDFIGKPVLLIQSAEPPDTSLLPEGYLRPGLTGGSNLTALNIGPLLDHCNVDTILRFRLRANPTRKVPNDRRQGSASKHPARVFLKTPAERLQWLHRQAENAGFSLKYEEPNLWIGVEHPDGWQRGFSKNDQGQHQQVQQKGVIYEGLLQIENKDRFVAAVKKGIGPGKSYGFGLISLSTL